MGLCLKLMCKKVLKEGTSHAYIQISIRDL